MTTLSKEAPWWQKVLLLTTLGFVFAITAGIEQPAEKSCCDDMRDVLSYRIKFYPRAWIPAPLGESLRVEMELIEIKGKTETPVPASFTVRGNPSGPLRLSSTGSRDSIIVTTLTKEEMQAPRLKGWIENQKLLRAAKSKRELHTDEWFLFAQLGQSLGLGPLLDATIATSGDGHFFIVGRQDAPATASAQGVFTAQVDLD